MVDMRVGDLNYGRGAAVVVHEDVATLPAISFDPFPQITRRYIENEYAVVMSCGHNLRPFFQPAREIRQDMNPVVRAGSGPTQR